MHELRNPYHFKTQQVLKKGNYIHSGKQSNETTVDMSIGWNGEAFVDFRPKHFRFSVHMMYENGRPICGYRYDRKKK